MSLNEKATYWIEPIDILQNMQKEILPDGWHDCLHEALRRLNQKAETSPSNCVAIKVLPWTCGACGKPMVQNLRAYGNRSFEGKCDNCGKVWIS